MSSEDDDLFSAKMGSDDSVVFDKPVESTTGSSNQNQHYPKYLQDAISQYIRENPDAMKMAGRNGGRVVPSVVETFHYSVNLPSHNRQSNTQQAFSRAVFDVLNEMTEGAVERRAIHYALEQRLADLHFHRGFATRVYDKLCDCSPEKNPERWATFGKYWKTYIELLTWSVDLIGTEYIAACEENGIIPSENLIQSGRMEYINFAASWMLDKFYADETARGVITNRDQLETLFIDVAVASIVVGLNDDEDSMNALMNSGIAYL